jgi:hypothetical protein
MNVEAILSAIAAATNFAKSVTTMVDEARETLGSSDQAAVESALQSLQAQNDQLHKSVSAKLDAASRKG